MSETRDTRTEPARLPVVPFLEVISRHRRLVFGLAIAAGIVAGIMGFIVPTTYETTVTLMPPDQSSPLGGAVGGGIQSTLAALQIGFAQIATSDLYADMLHSRSVLKYTIDKLGLIPAFGITEKDSIKAMTYALDRLDRDVAVRTANNGLIMATIRAHTGYFPDRGAKERARHLVARIGNTLVEGLDEVNRSKNTSRARQTRIFLEQQVQTTSQRLEKASSDLAKFQAEHLAIDIPEQAKAAIEATGDLQGQLLAREIALGVALQSMQPDNPDVLALQSEIVQLRKRIVDLQHGTPSGSETTGATDLGLDQLPDLGRAYADRLREVKVQETLFELLNEQYYRARIQETQDVPVVQVLDEATIPAFKKSPVIRKVGMVAGLVGLILGIFLAYALEWWARYPGRESDVQALGRIFRRRRP